MAQRGATSFDITFERIVETDDQDEFDRLADDMIMKTDVSNGRLTGSYVFCQYGVDHAGPLVYMYELTFDGSGNGTFQEIIDSRGTSFGESGSFTYSVASDGIITFDGVDSGIHKGIVSSDGNIMTWIEINDSNGSLFLYNAIKKSEGTLTQDEGDVQILFQDDFSEDLSQWTVRGTPVPSIDSGEGIPSPAFCTNGDGAYAGFGVSKETFDYIGNNFTLSADVMAGSTYEYVTFFLTKNNDISGTDTDPEIDKLIEMALLSNSHSDGPSAIIRFYYEDEDEYIEESGGISLDDADGWHNLKVKIRSSDNRIEFYIDDVLKYTSTHSIAASYNGSAAIGLGNRLAWHDNVEVTTDNDQSTTDTDGDGLTDDLESMYNTDPEDADTDDDGIIDGVEDANHNGAVDDGETDPRLTDSDNDGIQDGTESGYTLSDIGNDTNTDIFQPDLDPSTTTIPTDSDTDGDDLKDGEEDFNHNGRKDDGEYDPNVISFYPEFDDQSSDFTNQWWPMKNGTTWTFLITEGPYKDNTFIIKATGTEMVYGINCMQTQFIDPDGTSFYRWFAQDTAGSIQFIKKTESDGDTYAVNSDDDLPNTFMPVEPSVDDIWVAWVFDGHLTRTLSVVSTTAQIGSYTNCLKIKSISEDGIDYHYYKSGTGLVGLEDDRGNAAIRIDNESEYLVFQDDFSRDLSKWSVKGTPAPSIDSSEGNSSPAFCTNGDGNYAGFGVTKETFEYIGNNFTLSADVMAGSTYEYVTFFMTKNNEISGTDTDPEIDMLVEMALLSNSHSDGPSAAIRFYYEDEGEYIEESGDISLDDADGWHNLKVKIRNSDSRIEFYVDDVLKYTSTHSIATSYNGSAAIGLGNRLAWHDNVKVTTTAIEIKSDNETQSIFLNNGWNLISLDRNPENTEIATIVDSIIDKIISIWSYTNHQWQVYDPSNPEFSDLDHMVPGKGYWINISDNEEISISGSTTLNTIGLAEGWNLVGYKSEEDRNTAEAFSSIASNILSVWRYKDDSWQVYDPQNPEFSDLETMEAGYGYWINVTMPCLW